VVEKSDLPHFGDIVEAMIARYPLLARPTVERLVESVHAHFADARVQTFVPILVRREVESRLRYLDLDQRRQSNSALHIPGSRRALSATQ